MQVHQWRTNWSLLYPSITPSLFYSRLNASLVHIFYCACAYSCIFYVHVGLYPHTGLTVYLAVSPYWPQVTNKYTVVVVVIVTSFPPSPGVCLCPSDKSEIYRNRWTNRAGFSRRGFLPPIAQCVGTSLQNAVLTSGLWENFATAASRSCCQQTRRRSARRCCSPVSRL